MQCPQSETLLGRKLRIVHAMSLAGDIAGKETYFDLQI